MSDIHTFTDEQQKQITKICARYPKDQKQSAVMPVLWLLQEDNDGWLTQGMIEATAQYLDMEPLRVQEIVSFYTMFHDAPVGKHHVQVCRTLSCKLRGAGAVYQACRQQLNLADGELSSDGRFSLSRVECLGCCANAPVIQINKDIYEDLTPETASDILKKLQNDEPVAAGSALGRTASKPWNAKDVEKRQKNADK